MKPEAVFKRPGVSDRFLTEAGCIHVGENDCLACFGFRAEGIAIPFHHANGSPIVDTDRPFARVRLYQPTDDQKYHQRRGSSAHIYIPPGFNARPKGSTLVLVEGEFKAASLAEAGFAALGLCGLNGACRTINDSKERTHELYGELTDLLEIHRPARMVFLGDADVVFNGQFAVEAAKLRRLIFGSKRFAFVENVLAAKPPVEGPKGVDDCRAHYGNEFKAWFEKLLANALDIPNKATAAEVFTDLLSLELEPIRKLLGSDGHESRRARKKLLHSAHQLWSETGAKLELKPLLATILAVKQTEVPGLVRDAASTKQEHELAHKTPTVSGTAHGSALGAHEVEPWPDPVSGAELLEHIASTYERFCVLPAHAAEVLAVWVLATYCYLKFEFAAVVAVWSPEPECGKGRVLDVTEKLARRAFRTANTSAAVLYHSVSEDEITVLIDEVDSQSQDQREAIGNILKSGFQANGKAHRMTERNGEQVVVEFSTYCPKMLATIGLDKLDKATRSRSISIHMSRKKREDKIAKFRRYDGTEIQRKCIRWVQDSIAALVAVGPLELDECATDRQEDVWEPLVAVARVAGSDWEDRIRQAARHLSGAANAGATEGLGHQILCAMREYFGANGDKADTKTLIERLNGSGDFSGVNRGRGLTPYFLAQQLKPYCIEPRNLKLEGKVLKGYDRGDFDEAFQVYLLPPTPESAVSKRYSATEAVNIGQNPHFQSATEANGSVSENGVPTSVCAGGSGVADQKQGDADIEPELARADLI